MQVGGIQSGSTGLVASIAKASGFAYYDPRDTNQDGVVSATESLAYSLRHPDWGAQRTPASNQSQFERYAQNGILKDLGHTHSGLWNLYA